MLQKNAGGRSLYIVTDADVGTIFSCGLIQRDHVRRIWGALPWSPGRSSVEQKAAEPSTKGHGAGCIVGNGGLRFCQGTKHKRLLNC
uniref:Uncharacterized protein n=1 Tax=Gasterosteus aculeatus TaxID=69293 RepID=G3NMF0_GASAC